MKKILVSLMVLQAGVVYADDGFYTRALCISRDGSDPNEQSRFEPTVGFRTNPVRFSKKEKRNTQLAHDRQQTVKNIEQPVEQPKKKQKKQGKLSAWWQGKK